MNLRLLEIFCCVYEEKSFSKAAERLDLTQPTISTHIKTLEEFFEAPLFDRLGRSIEPTPTGKYLYDQGEKILEMKEHVLEAMSRFLNRLEGKLRIGASTVPGEFVLPAMIGLFRHRYPGIKIQLIIRDTRDIARLVAAGEVELGFVGGAWDDPELDFTGWRRDPLILVAPSPEKWEHPGQRIPLARLRQIPLLVREKGSGTRMTLERRLRDAKIDLEDCTVIAELGSTTAIIEAIRAGVGASFLSEISVRRLLATDEVQHLEIDQLPEAYRTFYMVVATRRTSSPLRQVFVDFLLQSDAESAAEPSVL